MAETERAVASTVFARDLLLLCSVLVGMTAGIGSQQALFHLTSPQIAANLSLALATTCTGAAHSRLLQHRKPIGYLLPSLIAGAPVVYGAMRAIHFIYCRSVTPRRCRGNLGPTSRLESSASARRGRNAPAAPSLLVAVTGIDGSGKGFVASRIVAELRTGGLQAEPINIDGVAEPSRLSASTIPTRRTTSASTRFVSRSCSLSSCYRFATPGHFVWKRTSRKKPPRRIGAMFYEFGPGRDCARRHLPAQAGIRAALRPLNLDRVQLRNRARTRRRGGPGRTAAGREMPYTPTANHRYPAQQLHFRRDNPKTTATIILGNDPRLLWRGPHRTTAIDKQRIAVGAVPVHEQ